MKAKKWLWMIATKGVASKKLKTVQVCTIKGERDVCFFFRIMSLAKQTKIINEINHLATGHKLA